MRENIAASLQMRENTDKLLADNLVKKEAQMNKLYNASSPTRVWLRDVILFSALLTNEYYYKNHITVHVQS